MSWFKTVLGWIIDAIQGWIGGVVTDEKIADDTKQIDAKSAEAAAELARLNELGQLHTTAANEAQVLTDKVAADDAVVKQAEAETKTAVERIAAIKRPRGIDQKTLADKLDKLNLDDLP